ncbi:hypothetical protein V6N13_029205 [Hibiscus sabdariffa]|uniref:Uncharacterized protein n=1 Tax=Hibiscus sabdariffa TaxID=183260 RepID=A0ABR2TBM9_9ROSI
MNGRFLLLQSSFSLAVLFLFLVAVSSGQGTAMAEPQRILAGVGKCSKADIKINQGPSAPLPSGIPTHTVEIINVCSSGCSVSDIHVACGMFSSTELINPKVFRRLSVNDCLVNDGQPLKHGASIQFVYSNTFSYPLSVASVACPPK